MSDEYFDDPSFKKEAIQTLQDLIRIDTTNPPGNETKAAEYIQDKLQSEGFDTELIESAPGRGNVITRIKGSGNGPSLLLIGHLDVVPAGDLDKWDVPPFSGELRDGFIWGRGALDMKGSVVAELMAFLRIHREGYRPKGDIIYAATADEEAGGHFGPGWLLNQPEHFEKIKADNVISEGGGSVLPIGGKNPNFLIQIAEKGIFWTKFRTFGPAGHGSIPGKPKEMAIIKMKEVLDKLSKYKPPIIIQDIFRETAANISLPSIARKLLTTKLTMKGAVWLAGKIFGEDIGQLIFPLVQNKITPTMLKAGEKVNAIPGECEGAIDVRFLPGYDRNDLNRILREVLGKKLYEAVEWEPIIDQPGGYTPTSVPFYNQIKETIQEVEPGAKLVPILSPGSTDLLHFRNKGMNAFGFVPMKIDEGMTIREMGEMPHGYNERISVDNLMFATKFFYNLAKKY
ncbi:MAG: M20/M25/M40 family metallo-hydrolase [Candidatus Helarchaeota archaeon]